MGEGILNANEVKEKLLSWSYCNKKWANCRDNDLKNNWKGVYNLIQERNVLLCKEWYLQFKIEELSPIIQESFDSVMKNNEWNLYPDSTKEFFKTYTPDYLNCWVSNPIKLDNNTLYFYLTNKIGNEEILGDGEIEFGIYEKSGGNFISKMKISEKEKAKYETDNLTWIQGNFTLISQDKIMYGVLFKNIKEWLRYGPHKEFKLLADIFENKLISNNNK